MKTVLAVDCGGSGSRKVIVQGTEILHPEGCKNYPVSSLNELLEFIAKDFSQQDAFYRVEGIALSVAGIIENHNKIIQSPNLPFLTGVNLGDLITQKLKRPTIVCNDAEAMAQGMSAIFPQLEYFMGITWSSGIGVRIVKNGQIISDSEAGHMQLDPSTHAPMCGCGKRGCAESILGGVNLQKWIRRKTEFLKIEIPAHYTWPSIFLVREEKWP